MNIILRKGKYALIDRGNRLKEIAVVYGLNKEKEEWKHTCNYWSYEYDGNPIGCLDKAFALSQALELFRVKTEENYIHRNRLEELATKFKDGLLECDEDFATEFFEEECELTENEREWLGITESEDDEDEEM